MTPACDFPLESRVNAQAMSPIASHCLVACAAEDPRIRLCDLRSGAFTHSLTGHNGSILSCIWSPRQEHLLCSGGYDGTVRLWDIRQASACLRSLDRHNSESRDPLAEINSAHAKGVNGLTFTSDGRHLISLGLDEKIRLWDTCDEGRHVLVNYGFTWRNRFKSYMQAVVSDADVWPPLLYVPSDDHQVLVFKLWDGQLVKRLKGAYGRVTCAETRPGFQELYSGSNDCEILVWEPTSLAIDEEEAQEVTVYEVTVDADGIARRVPKGQGTHLIYVTDDETHMEEKANLETYLSKPEPTYQASVTPRWPLPSLTPPPRPSSKRVYPSRHVDAKA
ncbi:DNA excision repair protein ERCC-8 [Apophysomyces ossiformis]|uniref:DNA excision repair protein ERCC-8 n=1 Tax=Apophysomyces ossiformis TaxID=679940 RepID=A0A8H7EU75_9FUNG|nr:DNA excision repair protein ERCC-8 [Apophysomyces ossiformis]